MLVLKTRRQLLSQVIFAPDGVGLAVAGQLGTFLWRSFRDDPKPVQVGTADCLGLGFDVTGDYLIAGIWYPTGIHVVGPVDQPVQIIPMACDRATTVTICPNTGSILVDHTGSDKLACWQYRPGQELKQRWTLKPEPTDDFGSRPAFGPDGSWFVRTEDVRNGDLTDVVGGSRLVFRSSATGELFRDLRIPRWITCGPAVSPDGEWIAFGSAARVFSLRVDGKHQPIHLPNDNKHQFTDVAFHPSGRYLAVTNNDKTVKLYDTTTWEIARTFTWEIGRMRCMAFSPDGTLAAAGGDSGKVVIWDVDA